MNWYKKSEKQESLHGGRADNESPSNYNKKDIEKGIKIEKEHTSNPNIAKEITIDHLSEFSNYYEELEKMEKKLKKQ